MCKWKKSVGTVELSIQHTASFVFFDNLYHGDKKTETHIHVK